MSDKMKRLIKGIQLKKGVWSEIGILTIIGISITLICGISYMNSFFERFFPEDYLIWIGGLLLGLLFIITDTIYIQKYGKTTILDSRLKVFGIIVYIVIFALAIDTFYFSFFISEYAILLTLIICVIFVIPAVIIGLSFFLILLRTPYAKIVESKNIRIFYIIIAVLLIVLPITLSWDSISPTYMGRLSNENLVLSANGNRLLLVSYYHNVISPKAGKYGNIWENWVWNSQTSEVLLQETAIQRLYSSISPDGDYIINELNQTIISVSTKDIVGNYDGEFKSWSRDSDYFATIKDKDILVWNTDNFSVDVCFTDGEGSRVLLSPDGSLILLYNWNTYSITMRKVFSENNSVLWQKTVDKSARFSWSETGNQIQIIHWRRTKNVSRGYRLLILNASDGLEIYNTALEFPYGSMASNRIVHTAFDLYIFYDEDKDAIFFYNLSGLIKKFNLGIDWFHGFDLSYDRKIMAWGQENGIIEIRNATTGLLINTLKTPLYEIERPIPFPSISYLLIGIVILALIIRRRKSKS